MQHLLRKAVGNEWRFPKRKAMLVAAVKATGVGLAKPLELSFDTTCTGCHTWGYRI
jgi:hypothetical protein